jgi:hypothetical protein
MLDFLLDI